jgi:hypothetical protein
MQELSALWSYIKSEDDVLAFPLVRDPLVYGGDGGKKGLILGVGAT